MSIDPTDTAAVQAATLNEAQQFVVFGNLSLRQGYEKAQDLVAIADGTACQLTNDERMRQDQLVVEKGLQPLVPGAEMLNPHRGINEDHATRPGRRRRTGVSLGSLPPSPASRLALSLATKASRPKRTSEVFSEIPVSLAALRSSSSSMLSVVLICIMMYHSYIHVNPFTGLHGGAAGQPIIQNQPTARAS